MRDVEHDRTDELRRDAHVDLWTRTDARGVARIASEQLDKEVWHGGLARVPAEPTPGCEARADAHRRAAARLEIVQHAAELSNRAAHVHVPAPFDLRISIRLGCAL